MNFALLGDHPDGLAMTRILVSLRRHQLIAYHGPAVGAEFLRRWGLMFETLGDIEDAIASMRESLRSAEQEGLIALPSSDSRLTFAAADGILVPN